jgi:hypothetical protein
MIRALASEKKQGIFTEIWRPLVRLKKDEEDNKIQCILR